MLLLSAGGGLSARGRVLLAGAGCWVLMAGAEALAGAQWRVRIPGAVGWVPKRRLGRNAGCGYRVPGAAKKFWTGRCGL